ncbi:MAG: helix-turn-helix domain-containing protein [Christensenellales bacterium]|jgi:quercetin dioxygenase-like cupin family protein
MDERLKLIAERLKALREILDISPAEMAKAVGMDEAEYLEYETGINDFSFSFLYTAAGRLGVDIVDLMTGETPRLSVCSFIKKGQGLFMERRKEYKYEHLAPIFKNKKMEPFIVTVDPKDVEARTHMHSHEGHEFDYVLEGSMMLYIDNQAIKMEAGDAVYYDAKHKHAMQAEGGPCRFLAVIAK